MDFELARSIRLLPRNTENPAYFARPYPCNQSSIDAGVNDISSPVYNRALEGLKNLDNLDIKFKCTAGCLEELKTCTHAYGFEIGCPPGCELTRSMRPVLENTERPFYLAKGYQCTCPPCTNACDEYVNAAYDNIHHLDLSLSDWLRTKTQ